MEIILRSENMEEIHQMVEKLETEGWMLDMDNSSERENLGSFTTSYTMVMRRMSRPFLNSSEVIPYLGMLVKEKTSGDSYSLLVAEKGILLRSASGNNYGNGYSGLYTFLEAYENFILPEGDRLGYHEKEKKRNKK